MRKRKFLKDVVNTLPHMIMGERMSYVDLETLANLPDGGWRRLAADVRSVAVMA
jgi:hypothetical protein